MATTFTYTIYECTYCNLGCGETEKNLMHIKCMNFKLQVKCKIVQNP